MKCFKSKTGKNSNYFRLLFLFSFYFCCAFTQPVNPEVNHFLDMLKISDGLRDGIVSVLAPEHTSGLYSHLKNLRATTEVIEINPELLNWASGDQKPRIFKNNEINVFFKKIFHLIEKTFPDIELNRANLFHAHLVQTNDDFLLVFHAFEYPIDLEPQKFATAKKINPSINSFTTQTENYKRRNLIWSLVKNKIWRIDTSTKSKFNFLVRSPAFEIYPKEVVRANALQENFFGKNIADINYFPSEENQFFINLVNTQ